MADEARHRGGRADVEVEVVATRALGIACREEHDLAGARAALVRSVEAARAANRDDLETRSLVSLASVLLATGAPQAALRELERAERLAGPADLALVQMQQATVLFRSDDRAAASERFDRAVESAQAVGDRLTEALALGNRGNFAAWGGDPTRARVDLRRVEQIFVGLGMDLAAADTRHNLGFAAAVAGRLAEALSDFAAARAEYERLGVDRPEALLDEARALLEANLVDEAHRAAAKAVEELRRAGQGTDLAEALLVLADARAAAGAPGAAAAASEARERFAAQGRASWSVLAAFTALRVGESVEAGDARRLAVELDAAGWADAAVDARMLAADQDDATRAEDLAAVAAHRRRGPAARRVRGWYALAQLRLDAGDRAGAARAATAGTRVATDHAVSLAATDLRARAGTLVEPLVRLGTGLALEARRGRRVLVWSERGRAGGLAPLAVPLAHAELGELRSVLRRLRDEDLSAYARSELDRRRRRLESEVDRRTRAAGATGGDGGRDLDVDALQAALGDRTLVEHVLHDDELHVITVDAERVRLHRPAPLAPIVREVRALRMAAARAARPGPAAARMAASAGAAASALDELLLGRIDAPGELVLVPSGPLHAVPWPLLPSLAGRAVTVCPSARMWLAAGSSPPPARRALVVSYGVPGGTAEAAAVAAAYDEAVVLDGAEATSSAVLAHLAAADVAHLAVHATFRSDNPLWSSLHLADGPLLVHDLDRLPRTPTLVVLAACGAARTSVDAGDELLGIIASFLRAGTRTLVASTLPVADDLAPPLMAAFHEAARTQAPAAALNTAGASAPAHAGAAFTCFGRG